jgi:hypothetical protein
MDRADGAQWLGLEGHDCLEQRDCVRCLVVTVQRHGDQIDEAKILLAAETLQPEQLVDADPGGCSEFRQPPGTPLSA